MEKLQDEIKKLKNEFSDGISFKDLKYVLSRVVFFTEKLDIFSVKSGKEKKQFVVNTISKFVNIPYLPAPIQRIVIGYVINSLVGMFNKKGWSRKVLKTLEK